MHPAEYLSNPARAKRTVVFTYDIVTPESAEDGDTAENGFYEPGGYYHPLNGLVGPAVRGVPGYEGTPVNGIEAAVRLIQNELGYVEPSSSRFQPGVWYTQGDSDTNYTTGAETRKSAHLHGFTDREQQWIWDRLVG